MYAKSLIVFALCTALVVGIVVVLNFEAADVNRQIAALPSASASCSSEDPQCPRFSIVSADLRTQNTTDQLGTASPVYLTFELNMSGTGIASVRLFIGNAYAGTVSGPFKPGPERVANLTLPATITVSPGSSYRFTVEGISEGGSYALQSENVTARSQVPYSS